MAFTFQASSTQSETSQLALTAPFHIDIESFLRENLGDFKLSFLRNGLVCTIGDLGSEHQSNASSPPSQNTSITSTHPNETNHDTSTPTQPGDSNDYECYIKAPSPLNSSPFVHTDDEQDARHEEDKTDYDTERTLSNTSDPAVNLYEAFSKEGFSSTESTPTNVRFVRLAELDTSSIESIDPCLSDASEPLSSPSPSPSHIEEQQQPLLPLASKNSRREAALNEKLMKLLQIPAVDSFHNEFLNIKMLLWRMRPTSLKALAAGLINYLYPYRRREFPYLLGVRFPGWPHFIRYKDPAHLNTDERLTLLMWCYFNPEHRVSSIAYAHNKLTSKVSYTELCVIFEAINNARCIVWE